MGERVAGPIALGTRISLDESLPRPVLRTSPGTSSERALGPAVPGTPESPAWHLRQSPVCVHRQPLPNFFIVGAPKSGTTALAAYLSQHPECYFSPRKELHYFCPDIDYHYRIDDSADYRSFFQEATDETAIGEGSVWYLYSPDAAENIYKFNPYAKIIISLRRPPEMLDSLHQQYVWNGYEDIEDLETALDTHAERKAGRSRPTRAIMNQNFAPAGLVYWEACWYYEQVNRFVRLFGRDNVLIIKFDDFQRDAKAVVHQACRHLGISDDFPIDPAPVNPRKKRLSNRVDRFLRRPPYAVRLASRLVPNRHAVIERLKSLNTITPKSGLNARLTEKVMDTYHHDIHKLNGISDADFLSWLKS